MKREEEPRNNLIYVTERELRGIMRTRNPMSKRITYLFLTQVVGVMVLALAYLGEPASTATFWAVMIGVVAILYIPIIIVSKKHDRVIKRLVDEFLFQEPYGNDIPF